MTGRASAEVIDLGVAASRPGKRSTMRWPYPADLDRVRNFYGHLNDTATNYRFFGIRLHLADSELGAVVGAGTQHITLLASIDEQIGRAHV